MRGYDGNLGLYHVVRAGGHLDAEMFPETMAIRNFDTLADYENLLCARHVEQLIHFATYDRSRRTNEHTRIDELAAGAGERITLHLLVRGTGYDIYAVDRHACPARPGRGAQ